MSASLDRIKFIKSAVSTVPKPEGVLVNPTQAQINAGFNVAKAAVNAMVQQLVPPWAMGMVSITDDEIHAVSDPVVKAALNS